MKIQTITWHRGKIRIVDQTRLPARFCYIYLEDIEQVFRAIRAMQVRGAPALAAAAALGVVLSARKRRTKNIEALKSQIDKDIQYLAKARPTAINLFWGLERMRRVIDSDTYQTKEGLNNALLKEALNIIEEDKRVCRKMGREGARLVRNGDKILTICNAGLLATIDYGTALGVLYRAKKEGKDFVVFACETRPLLQGARLSCWELQRAGLDVTLICDSMAATLMQKRGINKIFVGADRIARNGDVANKIGTYNLAVLAKYHKIPFYVVAPLSSFDKNIKRGKDIPIEERPSFEITNLFFKKPITPKGIKVFNPAFDITPHNLITAIITEKGILQKTEKRGQSKFRKFDF